MSVGKPATGRTAWRLNSNGGPRARAVRCRPVSGRPWPSSRASLRSERIPASPRTRKNGCRC